MKQTKHTALMGLMVSQALVLSVAESWIPIPAVVPGVKLGLANIVTLLTIVLLGYRDALLVVFLRCILASFFSGGIMPFLFSVAGGLLSTAVMSVLFYRLRSQMSVAGISVAGSVAHNIGQLTVAAVVLKDVAVFSYLPLLIISGVIMGIFIGVCAGLLLKALKKTRLFV